MRISAERLSRVRGFVSGLYTRTFDRALVLEAGKELRSLVHADYFSLCIQPGEGEIKPIIISNNPPDFIPVYLSVAGKDFLLEALIETGREYCLTRDPNYNRREHRDFIGEVQGARPISDMVYSPVKLGGNFLGHWGLGRAGLSRPGFSDPDLELFRFLRGFLDDAFSRSLLPSPHEEDLAYLDCRGMVIAAGARMAEALGHLWGWRPADGPALPRGEQGLSFLRRYEAFLKGDYRPGMDRFCLCKDGQRYSFLCTVRPPSLAPHCPGLPSVTVRLLEACAIAPGWRSSPKRELKEATVQGLTPREWEIIQGLRQAKSNKMIACELGIEESTVKRHTHNIYEKTGFRSRVELVLGFAGLP